MTKDEERRVKAYDLALQWAADCDTYPPSMEILFEAERIYGFIRGEAFTEKKT